MIASHNLPDLESDVVGPLILTNYKLILKPQTCKRSNDAERNPDDFQLLKLARFQAYFTITLGYLLSVEVKPVTDGPKYKYSVIELATKDMRKLTFKVNDHLRSIAFKDTIRACAFKDALSPELQFNEYFARVHFEFIGQNFQR